MTNTLTLEEAAALLKMHKETLREMAKAGVVPGAKPAKAWVFIEVDVIEFLRRQYKSVDAVGLPTGDQEWQKSTRGRAVNIGGRVSHTRAEAEYSKVLGLKNGKMPSSMRIKGSTRSGRK
jgi:excisionase family DNA binding protein